MPAYPDEPCRALDCPVDDAVVDDTGGVGALDGERGQRSDGAVDGALVCRAGPLRSEADRPGQTTHEGVEAPLSASPGEPRSEEHTSELQSLMRISYAVFSLKKKTTT